MGHGKTGFLGISASRAPHVAAHRAGSLTRRGGLIQQWPLACRGDFRGRLGSEFPGNTWREGRGNTGHSSLNCGRRGSPKIFLPLGLLFRYYNNSVSTAFLGRHFNFSALGEAIRGQGPHRRGRDCPAVFWVSATAALRFVLLGPCPKAYWCFRPAGFAAGPKAICIGRSFPGTPGVLVGRRDLEAWGCLRRARRLGARRNTVVGQG